MNRSKRIVAPLVLVLALVACASAPPDRIVYNTLDGAVTGVQTAMRAFNDLYQAGKASEADRQKVLDGYAKFQQVALTAAKIAPEATAPNANATQVALDAASQLVTLIHSLGAK